MTDRIHPLAASAFDHAADACTVAHIGRISHQAHPEFARWYARVMREGTVAPGTPVRVIPRP